MAEEGFFGDFQLGLRLGLKVGLIEAPLYIGMPCIG